MPRLPIPGSDEGTWGDILNEFLSVELASDGSLKRGTELTQKLNRSGDTMGGNLSLGGNRIIGLADPTNATDAATKNYVDTADIASHTTTHQSGGTDELNVDGLSGELADPQIPKGHSLGGIEHSATTLAALNAKLSDATLDDASATRTPTEHGNEAHSATFITAAEAPVQSVNGNTGIVSLDASDVGADPSGTATTAVTDHEAAADAHSATSIEFDPTGLSYTTAIDVQQAITEHDQAIGDGTSGPPQVDTFTASGTWVKPTGAKLVVAHVVAAGGGGSEQDGFGDGGGGGGGSLLIVVSADELDATEIVTVGSGGAGATAGASAGNGGSSAFAGYSVTGGGGSRNPTGNSKGGGHDGGAGSSGGAPVGAAFGGGGGGRSSGSAIPGAGSVYGGGGGSTNGAAGGPSTFAGAGGVGSTGSGTGGAGGIPGGGGGGSLTGTGGAGARGEVRITTYF
ncbi:MAG: hypothetical protein WD467_03345 [Candidatus Saccharimonadales bacterium]